MADSDAPETHVFDEPDDNGRGTVQESGLLYVGREHAGREVRWLIEAVGDAD
jgi:hypothetical protein